MKPMYHRYFNLQEEPFSIAVNPRYLFMSDRHRDALAHMLYGVGAGGGFVLLTGEVGTGKTTINRCLLEQLPDNTDIAIVLNPALNAEELLATVCDEMGISYDHDNYTLKTLTDKLHTFLLENHQRERRTVLLIDEAQHLQFDVLEQIRLLTNLETNTQKLLQIILVGQPELSAMLARPELRQLSQRISARFDLQPLNLPETRAYIAHRLQVAGLPASQTIFPDKVVRAVFKRTGGIPRLINLLCERMLLGSYGQNKTSADMAVLRAATTEVFGEDNRLEKNTHWFRNSLVALGLVSVLLWAAGHFLPMATKPNSIDAPVQPESSVASEPVEPWYAQEDAALSDLANHIGIKVAGFPVDCASLSQAGWECLGERVDTWNELSDFGRPVILSLITPQRFQAYAVLTGVKADQARLLYRGATTRVPLVSLAEHWRGEFTVLWQPPRLYQNSIGQGDGGPMVAWLADEFAALDGQSAPLAQQTFNAALTERVRYFQREVGLVDDGLVGVKTLLRLQQARGQALEFEVSR